MKNDPTLRRWFLKYNKLLFDNKLPLNTICLWEPLGPAVGETSILVKDPMQFIIKVDPCIMGLRRFTRQTLVHEQAHIKLWPLGDKEALHGKAWDEEIQRLTKFRCYRRML